MGEIDFIEVGNGIYVDVKPLQKAVQDAAGEDFPDFCVRACGVCNGNTATVLPECPAIKWDAFVFLKRTKGIVAAAQELRSEVALTVDADLIESVRNKARVFNGR